MPPLTPCDGATGTPKPRDRWSPEERAAWVLGAIGDAQHCRAVGIPVDLAALEQAEKFAGTDQVLLRQVRDLRLLAAQKHVQAPEAGRKRADGTA